MKPSMMVGRNEKFKPAGLVNLDATPSESDQCPTWRFSEGQLPGWAKKKVGGNRIVYSIEDTLSLRFYMLKFFVKKNRNVVVSGSTTI